MASTDAQRTTSGTSGASGVTGPTRARIPERTLRTDRWWLTPLATFVVFSAFVVFATFRAFQAAHFYSAPYLSPFYSPCLTEKCQEAADFGTPFGWWSLSPALLILIFPLGFRMSCYYYRKAYYRAFWMSPPACAVAEPHSAYSGETKLPLILNNVHRYFWYAAVVVALILTWDTILAFGPMPSAGEHGGIHMGLGTLLMLINIAFIWLYTLSCHSCRHVLGGRLRHFSKHPVRYRAWTFVSKLNGSHGRYAWYSLFSVALVDLYVWLLANGTITDVRFF